MTIALSTSKGRNQSAMDNIDLHWYVSLTSITTTKLHVFIKDVFSKMTRATLVVLPHVTCFLGTKRVYCENERVYCLTQKKNVFA